ncbi:MAG: complex I subunit 5 family protein [Desulfonatronovibrionaceae bacterium]
MIWLAVIFCPLVLAALLFVPGLRPAISRHGLWLACIPACLLAVTGTGADPARFSFLFLGTFLHFGEFGRVFLLLTSFLWAASGLFAGGYFSKDRLGAGRFSLFFLLTLCGNIGLCLAQDLSSFYVFFALMSFSAYGLIVHAGTDKALRAGRVYLVMTVLGEVCLAACFFYAGLAAPDMHSLLFAEIVPALSSHPYRPVVLVLAFVGFGIKAGALGLHFWLPLAHPAAPIPASAVLSGAMIKAGLLGWLQIFNPGEPRQWGIVLAWLGLGAAVYGVLAGVRRLDPKTILAYSSISQMGLMTMALGFVLVGGKAGAGEVLSGSLFFVLVHGTAKGSLFLGVGPALAAGRCTVRGRILLVGLILASLTLAGLPLSAGAVVKLALKHGAALVPGPWSGFFKAVLGVTAAGTMFLLSVFVYRLSKKMPDKSGPLEVRVLAAWAGLTGVVLLAVPLGRALPFVHIQPLTRADPGMLSALWPVGLGILLAAIFFKTAWSGREPAGLDERFLDLCEKMLAWLGEKWRGGHYCDPACSRLDLEGLADRLLQTRWMLTVPDRLEHRLLYWHTAGVLFVVLLLVFVVLAG